MNKVREFPFIEKELSWLSFNERVLQEAADISVPVIERARFLGIFSNNLDEFFRVRVAGVRRRVVIGTERVGAESAEVVNARQTLRKIQAKVLQLQEEFDEIYGDVMRGLEKHKIFMINENNVDSQQGQWINRYFKDKLLRHIAPIIINENNNLPYWSSPNLCPKTSYRKIEKNRFKNNSFGENNEKNSKQKTKQKNQKFEKKTKKQTNCFRAVCISL